jgi:hypothetical protein
MEHPSTSTVTSGAPESSGWEKFTATEGSLNFFFRLRVQASRISFW